MNPQQILQIDDLTIALNFLRDSLGFQVISSSSAAQPHFIQLKDEYSELRLYLIVSNLINHFSFKGGIVTITKPKTSYPLLKEKILSLNYSWNSLDKEENFIFIDGPNSILILITFIDSQSSDLPQSLLENYLQNLKNNSTNIIDETSSSIPLINHSIPPPLITNFSVQIFGINGFSNLIPNSRDPLYIETDAFCGNVLFLVRTKPLDQYYRHFFENNHRMYIIQIQGKFKRQVLSEELFMGLESNCSMGMMSKSIVRTMLKLVSNSGGTFRHSLGDSKNSSAYLAASLISAVDRMCVTPPDETPPPISCEFPESKELKSRRKMKSLTFNPSHTYSFTIKGKNIDFCEWSTCGFRMMSPNHLSTFIGTSPLRLVAYCEQKSKELRSCKEDNDVQSRRRSGLSYFLEIEIRSQVSTSSFSVSHNSDSESENEDISNDLQIDDSEKHDTSTIVKSDVEHNNNNKLSVEELIRSDRVLSVRLTGNVQNSSDDSSILKRPFSSPPRSQSSHSITEDSGIVVESADTTTPPAFTDTYLMTIPSADDNLDEGGVESQSSIFETRQRTRSMKLVSIPLERINLEWLTEDTKYCPAVIEINDYRRGRSRRVAYIVTRPNSPARLRSYMQLAEYIPLLMMDDAESRCGRYSETELRRRQLAISLKKVSLLAQSDVKIENIWDSIFAQPNDLDENFLRKVGNPRNRTHGVRGLEDLPTRTNSDDHLFDHHRSHSPTLSSFLSSSPLTIKMEGSVAICTGRRSWSEEWAILTGKYFTILNPQTAKHLRIPSMIHVGQIRSVNILKSNEKPFPNYEFFTIGTAARIYYFCVKNEYILSQWIEALLQSQLPPSSSLPTTTSKNGIAYETKELNRSPMTLMGDSIPEEPEACIVNPGTFSSSTSRVLNHRCLYFKGISPTSPRLALLLSKQILRQILNISKNSNLKNSINPDVTDWIDFSEKVSMLQSITLIDLSKSDLIAFFLNIYHTLLLHAYVVLGVPTSGIDWKALKSSISYEISGDIMTLRDIDEIILGNISNKVVVFNFLRIQLSQSEAYKQIESRRPKQLDPSLMFPSSRLYFGELWDYSIPMSHVNLKDILNTNNCDWRVALCITNGTADMSKHIYIYDGITLDQQLDKRCQDILAKRVRIDPTPPSILTNTPSISLPKSLSCLIPSPNLSNGRVSPGIGHDSIRNNHSPMSGTTTPTTPTSNIDDPRVWLSILIKYLETDIQRICEQLFQSSYKIYIYFDIPDYSVFKLIHLKSDDEFDDTIHPQQSQQQQQQPHENPLLESNEYQELKINQTRHSLAIISKSETRTQGDYDRSISLDSGHGNSPLKKHNTGPGTGTGTRLNSELQLGTSLFNEDNSLNDNEMKTKPPIPLSHTSTSPRPGNYQSIEDLRLALQTNPNKQKAKKKSIFGWGNSS